MKLNFYYQCHIDYLFGLTKEVRKELFNGLADWIIDEEPNIPSFVECKLWIKKKNSLYVISKNDEKEILMMLTYLPLSQKN